MECKCEIHNHRTFSLPTVYHMSTFEAIFKIANLCRLKTLVPFEKTVQLCHISAWYLYSFCSLDLSDTWSTLNSWCWAQWNCNLPNNGFLCAFPLFLNGVWQFWLMLIQWHQIQLIGWFVYPWMKLFVSIRSLVWRMERKHFLFLYVICRSVIVWSQTQTQCCIPKHWLEFYVCSLHFDQILWLL